MATDELTEHATEEQRVIDHVGARLAERFPDIAPRVLDEALARAWAGLADAPIRDFIEILVERDAVTLLHLFASRPSDIPTPRQRRIQSRHDAGSRS